MIEDTEPTQPADTIVGSTKATTGDEDPYMGKEDLTINVGDLYFNNQEINHQEFPVGNINEEVPSTNTTSRTSPSTTMDIGNE